MPAKKSPAKKKTVAAKKPAKKSTKQMPPRVAVLAEDALTPPQRALLDSIRSGPRGGGINIRGPIEQVSPADFEQVMRVNVTGTWLACRAVVPHMKRAGHGRIVVNSSVAGLKGYAYVTAYCMAKHAVVGFVRALAQETVKSGVTVNAVCPGYTDTDLVQGGIGMVSTVLLKDASDRTAFNVFEPGALAAVPGFGSANITASAPGFGSASRNVQTTASLLLSPDTLALVGAQLAAENGQEEIVAEQLRLATRALGKLLGRIDVEDVLDVIFRDFCIGK